MLPFLRAFDGLHISMTPEELFAPELASLPAQTTAPSGKKKNKNKKKVKIPAPPPPDQPPALSTPTPSPDSNNKKKKKTKSIVCRFDTYFGSGALADWQRLCRDVGLEGEYPSKNQCRKVSPTPSLFSPPMSSPSPPPASSHFSRSNSPCGVQALKTVYVNICDLMDAVKAGRQVKQFQSEGALANYCRSTRKIYPLTKAKEGGPVRYLLRAVF